MLSILVTTDRGSLRSTEGIDGAHEDDAKPMHRAQGEEAFERPARGVAGQAG